MGAHTTVSERLADAPVAMLVEAARDGDDRAWRALVDRFGGSLWAIARSHRLTATDAADVSQVTWLRLFQNLDRIEAPERVGAWLATTARREAMRVVRLSGRQQATSDDSMASIGDDVPPMDAYVLADERKRLLWELISRLPTRCQLILRGLTTESPLSYDDLSEAARIPRGSLGPTRARCIEHLRKLVAEVGISDEDARSIGP
jgi:RNA polymerase sigma factor (sigma-70 family)